SIIFFQKNNRLPPPQARKIVDITPRASRVRETRHGSDRCVSRTLQRSPTVFLIHFSRALALIACCGMIGVMAVSAQATDKKEEAKKEDAKKPPVKEEPKATSLDELKAKLKKHEEEVVKIRRAMLKEIEEQEKQLVEEIKKAKDAGKKGD